MEVFTLVVSIASGVGTIAGVIGILIRMGRDRGESDAEMRELRKDVDHNAKDINALGTKVNNIQLETAVQLRTLSGDMGWIKSTLEDIKSKIDRGARNA
ncbi:MAG: hypothetical protein J6Y16_11925 [Treponema sp.]|jgi:hypothetical protein|nr:hypothetical protein [Treponema sp.]